MTINSSAKSNNLPSVLGAVVTKNCTGNSDPHRTISRDVSSTSGPSQLRLPLEHQEQRYDCPSGIEPITVRLPDAIRMTGLGRSKIYELIASGDIETIKIGRCTLIPVESLHRLIENARR